MKSLADQISEIKSRAAAANATTQAKSNKSTSILADNRQSTAQMKTLQEQINNSPRVQPLGQLQKKLDERTSTPQPYIQKKENKTGLPNNLKAGIENLSGYSMDDVKVHYNSGMPAQLQAHAYAQGTNIHLGPGQEKHLPHEAWHVVQQKQGRVKPTIQMKGGVNVNDDKDLEKEADVMGMRAVTAKKGDVHQSPASGPNCFSGGFEIVQCNFISQNRKYKIEDGEKEKLYNISGDAPSPQPENLYAYETNKNYWKARVRLIPKPEYNDYRDKTHEKGDHTWFDKLKQDVSDTMASLPDNALYVMGKNDCQAFADLLQSLIQTFQSDEQTNKDHGKPLQVTNLTLEKELKWSDVSIGTKIQHTFNGLKKLTNDTRKVGSHVITIVAVDGTSKIALQANGGSDLSRPEFIGLNSSADWLNLVESKKQNIEIIKKNTWGMKNRYDILGLFRKKIETDIQIVNNEETINISHLSNSSPQTEGKKREDTRSGSLPGAEKEKKKSDNVNSDLEQLLEEGSNILKKDAGDYIHYLITLHKYIVKIGNIKSQETKN